MTIKLNINVEKLSNALRAFGNRVAKAVENALPKIQAVWSAFVERRMGGARKNDTAQYAAAVQQPTSVVYPFHGDPFYGSIVVNNKSAMRIEEGTTAWDMKPGLLGGPRARRSKKGHRYNIIPVGFPKRGGLIDTTLGLAIMQAHGISPFRTVSDLSPASSWWYPAWPAIHIRDEAMGAMTAAAIQSIQSELGDWKK